MNEVLNVVFSDLARYAGISGNVDDNVRLYSWRKAAKWERLGKDEFEISSTKETMHWFRRGNVPDCLLVMPILTLFTSERVFLSSGYGNLTQQYVNESFVQRVGGSERVFKNFQVIAYSSIHLVALILVCL
jgi:hypothetical protein